MNPNQPTTLLLIRHGETDANVNGQLEGATDKPLNENGRVQAQALARRLQAEGRPLHAIYSSSLTRARQTAEAVAAQCGVAPVHVEPNLSEFHLGEWDGLTLEELRNEKQLWKRMTADPHFAPPGGESAMQFGMRLVYAVRSIIGRHPGETVVIVSHGGALGTVMALLLDGKGDNWLPYMMDNCAISEVTLDPNPRLVRLNVTDHLASKPVSPLPPTYAPAAG